MPLRLPRLAMPRMAATAEFASLAVLFLASLALLSAQTYRPFIYFRF